jgi:hypothetical protein
MTRLLTAGLFISLVCAGTVAAETVTRCAKEGWNHGIVCRTESEPRYLGLGPSGYYLGRYLLGGEQREREAREQQAEELGALLNADCKSIGTTIYCRDRQ